ncbi:MAG: response regulator, partial [Thermodesulfobacteriota bacterium]|nr:response regulator [Thermodesulfobacteriota bacterium]
MSEKAVILIVDDDKIVRKILAKMLIRDDYRVIEAFEAAEGLSLAKGEQPDIILLDVMMPGMDGFETIQRLKSDPATAHIPIIFLSTRDQTEDKVKGLEMGASDYLGKPVDRAELIAKIRAHIKLKHQEEALREYTQNLEKMVEERTKQLI